MWITELPTSGQPKCGQFPRLCTELSTIDPREIGYESRYTPLRAIMAGIFHISTAIHSVAQDFGGAVIHSHPQCVKDGDGCGYLTELSTSGCGRILVHRLSRCYPPLIHRLSTILWIKGIPGESVRCGGGSDILRTWIWASPALRSVARLTRRRSYLPVVGFTAPVFGRFGVPGVEEVVFVFAFGLQPTHATRYASRDTRHACPRSSSKDGPLHAKNEGDHAAVSYSGRLPCFLRGLFTTLSSSMSKPRMRRSRVSLGLITSST